MIIGTQLVSRRYGDIFRLFLAVMLLGILVGEWTAELPVKEELAGNLNISLSDTPEGMTGDFLIIPEISKESRLDKGFEILAENRLGLVSALPEILEIDDSQCMLADDTLMSAGRDMENITSDLAVIVGEPLVPDSVVIVEEPLAQDPEPVIIPEESEFIPDNKDAVSEIPEDSPDNRDETEQIFTSNGFLYDNSGKIIGCQGVMVIDGVLCLPSDVECTGVSAGAFASLGEQIYEVYIPANIVSIDEGAFDGLTELVFIQVHSDNPVYGSAEGILFKK